MRTDGGIIRDVIPDEIPTGKAAYALNRIISKKYKSSANEPGFVKVAEYPGMVASGIIPTDKEYSYYFLINEEAPLTNTAPTDCKIVKIGKFVNEVIINDPALGFPFNAPITGVHDYNYLGQEIIAYTAEGLSPSTLNTERILFLLDNDRSLINPDDIALLKIFPSLGTPNIHLREILDTGGALDSGAYIFFVAYKVEQGFVSNFVQYSRPVYIYKSSHKEPFERIEGNGKSVVTGKAIGLGLTDLDTRYREFTLACIQIKDNQKTARLLGDYTYTDSSKQIVVPDLSNSTDIALETLLTDFPEFVSAKTLEISNSRLHVANVTREPRDIGLKPTADAIELEWLWEDPVSLSQWKGSYKDEIVIYDKQGFMAGEVYAFYICAKMKDGTRSMAYHIPGRAVQDVTLNGNPYPENALISAIQTADNTLTYLNSDAQVGSDVRYFHTRETAKPDGTMGYWENQDEFYENGSKVRHHKFPTLAAIEAWKDTDPNPPFDDPPGFLGGELNFPATDDGDPGNGDYGQRASIGGTITRVLGVRISNIQIPANIRSKIDSFEIMYAKRDLRNSTVIGQGLSAYIKIGGVDPDGRWENAHTPNLNKLMFYCFDMLSERVNVGVDFMIHSFKREGADILENLDPLPGTPSQSEGGIALDSAELVQAITETVFIPGGAEVEERAGSTQLMHGPFYELVPTDEEPDLFKHYHSSAMSFKRNVYLNFQFQELVSTCLAFKVTDELDYEIPKLYRGDTYTCSFAAYGSSTRITDAEDSCTGDADVRPMFVQSVKNIGLRYSSDVEEDWYLKYYPKYKKPFLAYQPSFKDLTADGLNENSAIIYRQRALCWNSADNASEEGDFNVYRQGAAAFLNDSYGFNKDFSVVFSDKSPLIQHFNNPEEAFTFPNLIARGTKKIEGELYTSLRKFLVNDIYEMRRDRGEITMLKDLNGELFIQCRNSLFKTVSKDTLSTDLNEIYLGSGDIFRTEPQELITADKGYAGSQSQLSIIKTKQGVVTVDSYMGKIFQAGSEFKEISAEGMRMWFRENLQFWFQKNYPDADLSYDNAWAPNGLGTIVLYDEEHNRLIISKKDYRIVNPDFFLEDSLGEILDQGITGGFFFAKEGLLYYYTGNSTQPVDFNSPVWQDLSWTWSYSFDTGEWIGEHGYIPQHGSANRNYLYSFKNGAVYTHNEGLPGRYYEDTVQPMIVDLYITDPVKVKKQLAGINWGTRVFDLNGNTVNRLTLTHAAVYNDRQCSGEIVLSPFDNIDSVAQSWKFSKFRDIVVDETQPIVLENYTFNAANLDPDLPSRQKKRFYGSYNVLRLKYDNALGYALYLFDFQPNQRILT